jgi:hypothetical protein
MLNAAHTLYKNAEVEAVVREWLRMQETGFLPRTEFLNLGKDGTNASMF